MNSTIRRAVVDVLEHRRLLAANLVSDAAGLLPTDAVRAGGYNYFFANDGVHGRELWKSDGTAAGTTLVADVTPGADGTDASGLTAAGDKVIFFTATAGKTLQKVPSKTYTMWTSDGTAAGTESGATFKNTILLRTASVGDRAVFSTYTRDAAANQYSGVYGTDGTVAGTTTLKTFTANEGEGGALVNPFYVVGGRAVASVDTGLFSFDGTRRGTVDLSGILDTEHRELSLYQTAGSRLAILAHDGTRLWTTDGTVAGSESHDTGSTLGLVNGVPVYYDGKLFVVAGGGTKTVSGFDLDTGAVSTVYTSNDASGHMITVNAGTGGLGISESDLAGKTSKFLISDGTAAGTRQVSTDTTSTVDTIDYDGVFYSVRIVRNTPDDANPQGGGFVGSLTNDEGGVSGTGGYEGDQVELWRSDGTAAGTGRVKVLLDNIGDRTYHTYTLGVADGKLTLRTESGMYNLPNGFGGADFRDQPGFTDTTEVYDASELTIGRQAAVARLVNGVLRIGGSAGDDNVLVYRRASDPEQLVVEYNGNTRVFKTSEVTRIKADLQGGADRFEVREGDEGLLRLRTSVTGGDGDDTIITASGRDTIVGGGGNDRLYGGRADDQISGGDGNDRINGQAGNDQINGGNGRDRVVSGVGVDVLFGMTAVERAFGTNADGQSYLDDVLLA